MNSSELDKLDRLMADKIFPDWVLQVADWHPTRDIAQAFQCAEKIGGLLLEEITPDEPEEKVWHACIGRETFKGANADTPAISICLAIEKWLEAQ